MAYMELHSPVRISFEHAWFLLIALARHGEIGVARCATAAGCDCATCSRSVARRAQAVSRRARR
jgi:hypothetical protein